jgi:S1-C subfamily serine protease
VSFSISTVLLKMSQHPLSRRKTSSPDALTEEDGSALPLTALASSHEQRQSFRGRSKSLAYGSLAWTMNTPRLPVGYENPSFFGTCQTSSTMSWEPILENAIKAIISIKASHVRSFDTETSGNYSINHTSMMVVNKSLKSFVTYPSHLFIGVYSATGFIVDAKLGIILSNRHVVSPAPIVAQAVLTNYEEVDLIPIYRDPVHDFGFLKFDPSKVKFMELQQIDLCPEKAKVGLEIRVVG